MNEEHYHRPEETPYTFFKEKLQKKNPSFWRRNGLKTYSVTITLLSLMLGYNTVMLKVQTRQPEKASRTSILIQSKPVGQTPQTRVTPTPFSIGTPTPFSPSGTLLCQADWSEGMDGWNGTADWKYVSHMLVNDGTTNDDTSVILAPCQFSTGNYAVEAEIQYVRGEGGFGLLARGDGGRATGYEGYIDASEYYASASVTVGDKYLDTKDYEVNTAWHTYRLEVEDEKLRFYIDGQKIVETTDTTYLATGRTGLVVLADTQINVKSFQVTAL